MKKNILLLTVGVAAISVANVSTPLCSAAPAAIDFRRDIESIFVKRCYECHGPDQQKSKLRLDTKANAFRGGKSGKPSIVPGKSSESEIIRRVTSTDSDEMMPSKGARLTDEQIANLRAWIDQGANWPDADPKKHWSFIKPERSALPDVKNKSWGRNEIDRFILARLEKENLRPSVEADRATLIRRLSLDLTGLPPTPAEVEAFIKDRSRDAYEKLVDRLLTSPHYGEHIARWWLDLARYADSNGYQVDLVRSSWPYRDWVINAFNRNQPFDQFSIEQLAGDLLPNATLEQKIATGFNRNTKMNDEGGGDAEEYRTKAVKDRVATTATTWLGLTMMCAECHTHKYDPLTQEDYYRFYGFFNHTTDGGNYSTEPSVAVPAPPVQHKVAYLHARIAALQRHLAAAEKNLPVEQAAWEQRLAGKTNVWTTLHLTNAYSNGGASYTNLPDQSLLAVGSLNPMYDTITVEAETGLQNITAVLLEVLPDPSLPKNGPGRWGQSGNFILDEFGVSAIPISGTKPANTNLAFAKATADWEQLYYRAEHAVDRHPKTGWAIAPQFGKRHFLIAELKEPTGFSGGTKLGFRFDHYHGNNHAVGRIRLSVTTEKNSDLLWPVPADAALVLATPATQRTEEQRRLLAAHFRSASPTIRQIERDLFYANQREAELAATKYTSLVMQERTEPRPTFVHVRGNFLDKGKDVSPGVPGLFNQLASSEPANRLALARWLVSADNPLTARVTVNRLWERFFGTSIVKTSEDFGRQGEAPSHPELLDWLATEFVRLNWDLKAVQKEIVMSATYRQSAAANDKLLEKDLYNRLIARGPRFRLDAETIRDQALAVSGLLNPEIGGPSVFPVQVANLWKEIGFLRPEIGVDEWPVSEGPDLYRRAVYTFWRRVCTYPTLATFDAPSREVCIARRPRTNTPLQALAGLNEPTLLEAARALAQRILSQGGGDPAHQLEFAFNLCVSRPPTKVERQRLQKFYEQQIQNFERDPQSAETLLNVGSVERPAHLDARKLAAWMMVANVLLNLDETITKG
ncbi:MAG: PSD1 domain-containing protein [Verrucomicrobia bacterium]|nr:PSD1 domain-containing protein [Verrucomicrobiota bacterium]